MPVITIPFDYDPEKHAEVPIFLNDSDDEGQKIHYGWIEAVLPIQEQLRSLSRRVLHDVWRVSELTDITIHNLWTEYRENVGTNPSFRVYKRANKTAHRLEDPGARVHSKLNISLDWLDEYRKEALISDDSDTERNLNRLIDTLRLEEQIRRLGTGNDLRTYKMVKAGYFYRQIGPRLGERPNTIYRRLHRLLRKIADSV